MKKTTIIFILTFMTNVVFAQTDNYKNAIDNFQTNYNAEKYEESNEMLKDDRNRNKRKRNEQTSQRFSKIKRTATYHTMPKLCSTFTFAPIAQQTIQPY